jgi:hypothetical protein
MRQNESAAELLAPQPKQLTHFDVDDSKAMAGYANCCRLSGTPEELILDFGFAPQPIGDPTRAVELTQRIVTGWHTAKRLLYALQLSVQRHETAFGALETDVRARARHAQ